MNALPRLALSIRQPWVWCIFHGGKPVENRDWSTRLRGPICVHASQGMTRDEYEDCLATIHHISLSHPFPAGLTLPAFEDLPRGGIVGTVEIVDCVEESDSPWFFGRYGFVLRNPQILPEIIPVKGALGFFDWRERLTGKPDRVVPTQGAAGQSPTADEVYDTLKAAEAEQRSNDREGGK